MTTTYVRPGEGRHHPMIDGDHVAKAAVKDAYGSFEVIAPGAPMAPPHVSPWTGVLFLLEGHITAMVDGASYDVEPGGEVVFPAGTPATFGVRGDSARFVAVTSGDGAGRFFATSRARCRCAGRSRTRWRPLCRLPGATGSPLRTTPSHPLVLDVSWSAAVNRAADIDPGPAAYAFDAGNRGFANVWIAMGSFAIAAGWVIVLTRVLHPALGWWAVVADMDLR